MNKIYLIAAGLVLSTGLAGLPAWAAAHLGEEQEVVAQTQVKVMAPITVDRPIEVQSVGTAADYKAVQDGVTKIAPRDAASGQASGKRIYVETEGWGATVSAARIQDFEKNTENKALEDENITAVDVAPDHVDITYKHSAKLFGFLPMTMNLHAIIDKDGNLKTQKPWYSFLTTSEVDAFSAAVQADFKLQQENLKTFKIQDLLQRQAQYFQTLSNVLKTRHDTVKNSIGNIR